MGAPGAALAAGKKQRAKSAGRPGQPPPRVRVPGWHGAVAGVTKPLGVGGSRNLARPVWERRLFHGHGDFEGKETRRRDEREPQAEGRSVPPASPTMCPGLYFGSTGISQNPGVSKLA